MAKWHSSWQLGQEAAVEVCKALGLPHAKHIVIDIDTDAFVHVYSDLSIQENDFMDFVGKLVTGQKPSEAKFDNSQNVYDKAVGGTFRLKTGRYVGPDEPCIHCGKKAKEHFTSREWCSVSDDSVRTWFEAKPDIDMEPNVLVETAEPFDPKEVCQSCKKPREAHYFKGGVTTGVAYCYQSGHTMTHYN